MAVSPLPALVEFADVASSIAVVPAPRIVPKTEEAIERRARLGGAATKTIKMINKPLLSIALEEL